MAGAHQEEARERARIVLQGERVVDHGVGLAVLGRVLRGLADVLRTYARSERAVPARRMGTTTSFEEAVTDLRLVDVEPGSLTLVLEEPPADTDEQIEAPHIAINTLDSLIRAAQSRSLSPDVAEAFERSLAPLGDNASISVRRHDVAIRVERGRARELARPAAVRTERPVRIVGRLRALDLDRTKIAIRTTEGALWACRYPEELASTVIEAINRVVVAHGMGWLAENGRGQITLEELEIIPEVEQTSLFELAPRDLSELAREQGVTSSEVPGLIPPDATDEEIDAFLAALGES